MSIDVEKKIVFNDVVFDAKEVVEILEAKTEEEIVSFIGEAIAYFIDNSNITCNELSCFVVPDVGQALLGNSYGKFRLPMTENTLLMIVKKFLEKKNN